MVNLLGKRTCLDTIEKNDNGSPHRKIVTLWCITSGIIMMSHVFVNIIKVLLEVF